MRFDYSFWELETYKQHWDICIIGAGISGLSTGISLLERMPDSKILIVDRWFIPLGASTRNAGFSCFGSPSEILEDMQKMGVEAAMQLIQKRWKGLHQLRSRIAADQMGYETLGGYELFHPDGYAQLVDHMSFLNQSLESITGSKNVFKEIPVPDGIQGFSNAIYNALDGQLQPALMMEALKNQFLQLGGHLATGIEVEEMKEHPDHVRLHHHLTFPITADRAIITINGFAKRLIPHLDVQSARNLVIVTGPVKGLKWKGCFHYDRGYYYFRNIGDRILLGGARNADLQGENTETFGTNPTVEAALEDFLYDHLLSRGQADIEFRWSGIIGIGSQKLPIVEAISPRIWVGVRLSGMGIALASVLGEEIAEDIWQQERNRERL